MTAPVTGRSGLVGALGPSGPVARTAPPARPAAGSADHSARLLARAVVEVLAGHRPSAQLRTFCTPATFATLDRRGRNPSPALPHMLSVRVCEPAEGVAEVTAVFRRGDRVRMVAFRLERLADPTAPAGGRWTITAVQPG